MKPESKKKRAAAAAAANSSINTEKDTSISPSTTSCFDLRSLSEALNPNTDDDQEKLRCSAYNLKELSNALPCYDSVIKEEEENKNKCIGESRRRTVLVGYILRIKKEIDKNKKQEIVNQMLSFAQLNNNKKNNNNKNKNKALRKFVDELRGLSRQLEYFRLLQQREKREFERWVKAED